MPLLKPLKIFCALRAQYIFSVAIRGILYIDINTPPEINTPEINTPEKSGVLIFQDAIFGNSGVLISGGGIEIKIQKSPNCHC